MVCMVFRFFLFKQSGKQILTTTNFAVSFCKMFCGVLTDNDRVPRSFTSPFNLELPILTNLYNKKVKNKIHLKLFINYHPNKNKF